MDKEAGKMLAGYDEKTVMIPDSLMDESLEQETDVLRAERERMTKETERMLAEYDARTLPILETLKLERDQIREETERLQRLIDELGGKKNAQVKAKKNTNAMLQVATFLAWTFALASANEAYKGLTSEEGLTFIGR